MWGWNLEIANGGKKPNEFWNALELLVEKWRKEDCGKRKWKAGRASEATPDVSHRPWLLRDINVSPMLEFLHEFPKNGETQLYFNYLCSRNDFRIAANSTLGYAGISNASPNQHRVKCNMTVNTVMSIKSSPRAALASASSLLSKQRSRFNSGFRWHPQSSMATLNGSWGRWVMTSE